MDIPVIVKFEDGSYGVRRQHRDPKSYTRYQFLDCYAWRCSLGTAQLWFSSSNRRERDTRVPTKGEAERALLWWKEIDAKDNDVGTPCIN